MSHFTVIVVTPNGTEEEIAKALAPFHEFECTGIDDQYIQNIDITAERREEYENATTHRFRDSSGALHLPYEDRFYREPTSDELEKYGPMMGFGFGGGLHWSSKDWGDGMGYRPKVHFIPDGFEEITIKTSEIMTFARYLEDDDVKFVDDDEDPDTEGEHKYGYARIRNGEVVEVIRRTNPNKKWDWWVVGGRWRGSLTLKIGQHTDSAKKSDINWERMMHEAEIRAIGRYEKMMETVGEHMSTFIPWPKIREMESDINTARERYREQPAVVAMRQVRDFAFEDLEDYVITRDEFVQRARKSAVTFFAFLRNGQWHERGEMGMWAFVSNEKEGWPDEFGRLIDEVGDNEYLTLVDCHI